MVDVQQIPELNTTGKIARLLKVTKDRVQHVLRSRPYIRPSARAGRTRLYSYEAVAQIRQALNGIDARRCEQDDQEQRSLFNGD